MHSFDDNLTATLLPDRKTTTAERPKQQPRYNVVLWDDNDHSYDYVIAMMQKVFGYTALRGFVIAKQVDTLGKAVCLTTTLEHAELKREQLLSFGRDQSIPQCKGAMTVTLEPVD